MKGESECDCVKKIGILTFHKSINYGSVLQAFALSDLLSKRGYAVEIIDYEPTSYSIQYRIFEKNTSVHNVAANIRRLSVFDILWKQKKGFEKFREEHLPLSACKFTRASSPQEFSKYYGAVICGSDQIWNVTAKDCDPIFFLPGKQSYKKIAYAASVNTATYNEDVCDDQLRKNILDFDYISIREHSGAKKISRFLNTDKQVKVQPDPSLLQTKEVFAAIASTYLLFAESIGVQERTLYYLTIREGSANVTSNGNPILMTRNKIKLIDARKQIDSMAIKGGVNTNEFWQGTLIFSAVQLALRLSHNSKASSKENYAVYVEYLNNPDVQKAVKNYPPVVAVKALPFYMLKWHMGKLLFHLCKLLPESVMNRF